MRKLPVYFVLDCSESMVGPPLEAMQKGLTSCVKALCQDPHALETVHICVIAFAGKSEALTPLVELPAFYPPQLPLGGGTSLGAALTTLMASIDKQVTKKTQHDKGDYKPVVWLITDGRPTDEYADAIKRWKESYQSRVNLVAVAMGYEADTAVLKELTEQVVVYEPDSELDFTQFIEWVTQSIVVQSQTVAEASKGVSLAKMDDVNISLLAEIPPQTSDDTCVCLVGKCSKTGNPYVFKYEKFSLGKGVEFNLDLDTYHMSGCYPVSHSYFDWSDERFFEKTISTDKLRGVSGCPHCGNQTAFAVCGCGKMLCINEPGTVKCPWCHEEVTFRESGDNSAFDVSRGRG